MTIVTGFAPQLWVTAPPARTLYAGLDIGQAADYTALSVLERVAFPGTGRPCSYLVRHLHRWPLHTPYPSIVADLWGLYDRQDGPRGSAGELLLPRAPLVVDATGVGRPLVEMLRQARPGGRVVPVVITGGHGASWDDASCSYHVPKRDLVFGALGLLQQGRLKFARGLSEGEQLARELSTFTVKVSPDTGNETLEAWRERDHDDLVLSVCIVLWYSQRFPYPGTAAGPCILDDGKSPIGGEGVNAHGRAGALGFGGEGQWEAPWW